MVDDEAILRGYPGQTSVEDAASAVARVVQRAVKGDLAPEVLESARRALSVMSKSPDVAALPGLLETMNSSRDTFEFDALSLCTGSLRAMLAMRSLITSPRDATRIIKVIAESCLSALRSGDEKIIRFATRYSKVGVQFTEAFDKARISHNLVEYKDASVSISAAASVAAALSFGVSLNLGSDTATATAVAPFFEAVLLRCPSAMWRTALAPDTCSEIDAVSCTSSALYVARWIVSHEGDEKRASWMQACQKASLPVLSALLDLSGNHEQVLLCSSPKSSTSSYAALLSLSVRDISQRFFDDAMLDELLSRISSSSATVYCVASLALAAVASSHPGVKPRIHQMVDGAYSLARACGSPHAEERWKPLGKRLGLDGNSFTDAPSILKQPFSEVKYDPMASVVHSATWSESDRKDWAERLLLVSSQLRRIEN